MFIGHFAVGFASKRIAPRASLGALIAAPLLLDLLWPILLLLRIERVRIEPGALPFLRLHLEDYPWSHSLLMSVVWALLFGGGYALVSRYPRGGVVIALGVFSHWVFDFVTHRPDMPLYPGGPEVGLGLWNSTLGTIAVETLLLLAGIWVYLKTTQARDRKGGVGLWTYVAVLLGAYIASIVAAPPPSWEPIAWGGLVSWLFPIWAHWFDRHRGHPGMQKPSVAGATSSVHPSV